MMMPATAARIPVIVNTAKRYFLMFTSQTSSLRVAAHGVDLTAEMVFCSADVTQHTDDQQDDDQQHENPDNPDR